MELNATIGTRRYAVKLDNAHDISIHVNFETPSLSAFGAAPASHQPYTAGTFIGDVTQGGSCNCDMLNFAPHLHGTHTESIGHITREKTPALSALEESLIPATVISVLPENNVITGESIKTAIANTEPAFLKALVIRTLPNTDSKRTAQYGRDPAPYFSADAMELIVASNVQHLLCDLPSVDKMDDGGKLQNHRLFWELPPGSTTGNSNKTITELIYVNNTVTDGSYLLNLQLAPLVVDATSSRPLLYEIEPL